MHLSRQFYILLFLLTTFTVSWQISDLDKERIKNGLSAAKDIVQFLIKKDFFSTLTKVASIAGPIFQVASIVLDIVFMFLKEESPELKLMKKEFGDLQNRLDSFTQQFDEVKRKINWGAVQVSFFEYEATIRTMISELRKVSTIDASNADEFKKDFIRKYETGFSKAPNKLANAIIKKEAVFSDNLIDAARQYTENHRYFVQDFMVGLVQLIIEGMEIEASYIQMKYSNQQLADYMKSLWDKEMAALQAVMTDADKSIEDMWHDQLNVDVENFANRNPQMINRDFSGALYSYLTDKYRWRLWFVISYAPISGWNVHAARSCYESGKHQLRVAGRNILVSSIKKDEPSWGDGDVDKEIQDIRSMENRSFRGGDFALQLLNQYHFTCSRTKVIAVIGWGSDVWFIGAGNHVAYHKVCIKHCPDPACWFPKHPCYNVFKFG